MKKCDYCGRENADDAAQCSGCGTPLQDSPVPPPLPESPARAAAEKRMIWGAIWCILGIAVTGITYVSALSAGGSYIVAWGAIVFGGIQFFQGLAEKNKPPTTEEVRYESLEQPPAEEAGYDALEDAIKMEAEGHVEDAMSAYERIARNFPETRAARDALKSIETLKAKRS